MPVPPVAQHAPRLVDEARRFAARRGAPDTREGYLLSLAQFLCDLLDVEYVIVDRIGDAPGQAYTEAICSRERPLPPMIYPLLGTPCEQVFGKTLCVYRNEIQERFPDDAILRELGIQSYAGTPLWNSAGEPIGLIAVMDVKPLPEGDDVAAVLQVVAPRAAFELESRRLDDERKAHIRFVETLDRVNSAMRGPPDLADAMGEVLDVVLAAFGCDRAWLQYPCDVDARARTLHFERTRPEYPGASLLQTGLPKGLPIDDEIRASFRAVLESETPVQFRPGSAIPVVSHVAARFGVKSVLAMALRPKLGQPWMFGLHQCSRDRTWTRDEEQLFQEIGRRLADGLTGMIAYRDLQASEQLFRSVAENSPDLIVRYAPDGRYLYVSPVAERLTGMPASAFVGRSAGEPARAQGLPVDEAELGAFQAAVSAVFRTGEPQRGVLAMVTAAHAPVFAYHLVPERDASGRIVSVLGIARDETERLRAERIERQLHRKVALMSELSQKLVHATDEHRLLDDGCRILAGCGGYAGASIELMDPSGVHDAASHAGPRTDGAKVATAGADVASLALDLGRRAARAGATTVWRRGDVGAQAAQAGPVPGGVVAPRLAAAAALPLRHEERILGVLLIGAESEEAFPDEELRLLEELAGELASGIVTLRARAAEAAREAALAEAVELARQRSRFIAQLSHELRTPLNAILGCAQLLERKADEGLQRERLVRIILDSGEHLLALIEDILDLARIDAGKLQLREEQVALGELLESVGGIFRMKAEEKGLEFRISRTGPLPGTVRVDAKRLRQVLLNLLSNAVKFTDRGSVALAVTRVDTDPPGAGEPGRARLRFEVEDSGIGMSEAQKLRLFRPFEQLGEGGHRNAGAGLGLAISLPLVRMMGGDIRIRSEPGVGSVFAFELEVIAG